MPKEITNFIFDIDGTLINTFDMYMPALFATLANHGYHFTAAQVIELEQKLYGLAATNSLKELGVVPSKFEAINQEWMKRAYDRFDQVTVIPGVAAALFQLAARPDRHLAIVTSKTRGEYDRYFRQKYDFAGCFSTVVTADDTDKHKPDPAPILAALSLMNARPDSAVYIGDMATDLMAAHAAGIKFAGADYGSVNPAGIAAADFQLKTPAEILQI